MQGQEVQPKEYSKHQGVTLDKHLPFEPHVIATATKALKTMAVLSRLMLNIGGPTSSKRRTLASVVFFTVMYAVPVRKMDLNYSSIRRHTAKVQRSVVLRVFSAYRSILGEAALVFISMPRLEAAGCRANYYHGCQQAS